MSKQTFWRVNIQLCSARLRTKASPHGHGTSIGRKEVKEDINFLKQQGILLPVDCKTRGPFQFIHIKINELVYHHQICTKGATGSRGSNTHLQSQKSGGRASRSKAQGPGLQSETLSEGGAIMLSTTKPGIWRSESVSQTLPDLLDDWGKSLLFSLSLLHLMRLQWHQIRSILC